MHHELGAGVVLCLPADLATMSGRTVVTELGPDIDAVRLENRDATLFDLGLGGAQAEICVRSRDPETIALLRSACGQPLLTQGTVLRQLPARSPHRVFRSRLGRIEVYQPIPPPGGRSSDRPHTHVLPRLLANELDNAATVPVPSGWLAGMTLYPAHPLLRPDGEAITFDAPRFHAFQALMEQYGDPDLQAGKHAAFSKTVIANDAGADGRRRALGHRIGERQARWLETHATGEAIAAKS